VNSPLAAKERTTGTLALFGARAVYAFNWYNIGAVLPLVGQSFHVGLTALGVVLAAFLVGVGVFQVPAGLAAIRWTPRSVSLLGIALMGGTCLASGFAPNIVVLAVTRFFAGVGAAFFFSPGLSLIASYYPEGRRGPAIGLYNGAFSVGGAVALFGGALFGSLFGWPATLAVGGAALLLATAVSAWILPRWQSARAPRTTAAVWASGRSVLRSPSIWGLALGLTGFWAAIYIVSQAFIKYATDTYGPSVYGTAAALAAVVVVLSVVGGPAGGWFAERGRDRRAVLAATSVIAGALVLAIPFVPLIVLWPTFVLLGIMDGAVFAIMYLIPSYLAESRGEGVALAVAFINSVQVLLGSAVTVAFGVVADLRGYTVAWLTVGALSLALLPLLAFVLPTRASSPLRRWTHPARAGGEDVPDGTAPEERRSR
jgi:MFS family permease